MQATLPQIQKLYEKARYQRVSKNPNGKTSIIQIPPTEANISPTHKHVRVGFKVHWTSRG